MLASGMPRTGGLVSAAGHKLIASPADHAPDRFLEDIYILIVFGIGRHGHHLLQCPYVIKVMLSNEIAQKSTILGPEWPLQASVVPPTWIHFRFTLILRS